MKAMIFAAGLGTRLKPLTDTMPKALVPVNGKPLLWHVAMNLKKAGANHLVINVHHFAQQVIDYVNCNDGFGMKVDFSDETQMLLETGGALKKAAPLLQGEQPVLIHNVDILSNENLSDFYAKCSCYDAALLVSERSTSRYLLADDNGRLVGWTNIKTGEVKTPFQSLNVDKCHKYAFSGIHLFSPRLLEYMEKWPEKFSIIDFYLSVCDKANIVLHNNPSLRLMDVGKLDTLSQADEFLKSLS